jgi:hypothetical protein
MEQKTMARGCSTKFIECIISFVNIIAKKRIAK